jgi:hypothetical protein
MLISALEGAMLVARSFADPRRLRQAVVYVLRAVGVGGHQRRLD